MRTVVLPEGAPAATQSAFAQILAVHAALLPTGKILYFGGDQHDPGLHHLGLFDHARLFDCQTFAITTPVPSPTIRDLFCCGHTLLADGRLLVAGGTESWAGAEPGAGGHGSHGIFRGTTEAYVFEPVGAQWAPVPRMVPERFKTTGGGRWYPTLVTLGNGEAVAVAGPASNSDTRHDNNTIETYTPAPAPGYSIDRGTVPGPLSSYPRVHLIKDATLFSRLRWQVSVLDGTRSHSPGAQSVPALVPNTTPSRSPQCCCRWYPSSDIAHAFSCADRLLRR